MENLSIDVLRYVFGYLTLEEIRSLDLAFTSTLHRPSYLQAIHGYVLQRQQDESSYHLRTLDYLKWCLRRGILLSHLYNSGDVDESFRDVMQKSSKYLRELYITDCRHFPPNFWKDLGPFPVLHEICITDCDMIECQSFFHFLSQCLVLEYLALSRRTNIASNDHTPSLPSHLEHLDLSTCRWCTDESFVKLISQCTNLQSVDISFTPIAQTKTFNYLLNSNPNLQFIKYQGCNLNSEAFRLCLHKLYLPGLFSSNIEKQRTSLEHLYHLCHTSFVRYSSYLMLCCF